MDTKSFQRKHIVPKLNLNKLATQNHALSSRETTALLNSVREVEYDRALTFESNRYSSKRPELWSASVFKSRKNKTYEEYGNEMYNKIWKNSEKELSKQVSELTLKLDKIRQELSSGKLTFKQAGKLLSKIRREYMDADKYNDNDDDLICCLHLVEKLWECINGDGLSCSEFSSLLSNMFGKPKKEFDVLFQKMDADGDETLSWNEYVSFLSQQQAHLWDQQENKNVSYFKEQFSTVYNNCTGNHMFDKIRIINGEQTSKCTLNSSKYAVLTSDNCIQIRNAMTLQLESSINLNNNCTNLCCLNASETDSITRLAVSFMDRSINIYSPTLNNNNKQSIIHAIDTKKYKNNNNKIYYDLQHSFFALDIPMCMEVFNEKESTLLVGETYGTIGLYNYLDHNCLVRVNCHGNENSNGPCVVKQVKKVPRIGIVSAGMDTNIVVTDCVKWCKIRTLSGHTRGVYSIAFSSTSHRMLISAGYDRKICVWDPYITKPLGLLKGHIASVVGVLINEKSNQIITASRDKKIKIWDMRTWKCLQTIRDTSIHSPINELSSIQYDPYQSCLITAGSKFKKWYVQNIKCDDNTDKKLAPIIDIVYSNIFQQIISVHVDDTCILWDIKTGQNSFNFKMNNCDSNSSASIATIAIDEIGKRLLTASQNGIIKMWNFNNGAVMHQFARINFEITNLIYLPRTLHCVVCCGYSCIVNRCPSHLAPTEANFILQNKLHKTDVRAMCITKQYLLTGSSDGVIIEWHIDSNVKSQIFHCKQPHVSITAMYAHKLNENKSNWYLFVGTEEGIIHIFEKDHSFKYVTSISDKYIFNEPILYIAINELGTRLMIADCDVTMKLFDIQNLYKTMDFILIKQWKPHQKGCITSLLYIPGFDVFCSSSDNGQLILWNLDGIFLGQFGQNTQWNLFGHNIINKNISNNNNDHSNIAAIKNNDNLQHNNSPPIKRKSYFDDHAIYRPKFINTVVTESIARTLLEDRSDKEIERKKDKTQFEQTLDKLMLELMKPKKRKRSCRKSSIFTSNKPRTSRKNSRMKM